MASPRTKEYYTEQRKAEMVAFANESARVPKAGRRIIDINVGETIARYPFVAFIQDDGEVIRTEWF